MKNNKLIIGVFILSIFFLSLVSANELESSLNGCEQITSDFTPSQVLWITGGNFTAGFHSVKMTGTDYSCHPDQVIWGEYDIHFGNGGEACFTVKQISDNECGEYIFTIDNMNTTYYVNNPRISPNIAIVPEFSLIGGLTLVLAGIVSFLFIRKR